MTETRRVVIKGAALSVARIMADAGIPFVFVREAGPNTVGDVVATLIPVLTLLLGDHPELEGRFARA